MKISTKKKKIKKKKKKKHLEITSLYTSVPKIMIIFYIAPELWRVTVVIVVFPFGLFLALYPHPPTPPL